ncbi:ABC transporter permease [Parasulfuritortus cantonensis]|uniref:ABC transporter permease n=2 Tax=Parasulfuritortus cantonensis TaxID=2528202 RepID=A0A4R1BDB0_9PROT|nr:ABC transporter permease [Parasulfuritortus cantonensis]
MPAMDAIIQDLTRRGAGLLAWLRAWRGFGHFAAVAIVEALTPASYNNATRSVVQKQIYFTAWQILPTFTVFSAVLSFVLIQIVVDTARNYGFAQHALEASVRILVLEILPLLTALFVGLRSGAAINTEVALMVVHNEMKALEDTGVDPMRFEFIPRVIGGVISVLALTAVASAVALVLAYLAVYGFQAWSVHEYNRVMGNIFNLPVIAMLWAKVFAFGLAVTVIPISEGLAAPAGKLFFVPISVLRGMVRLFFVLMLVEVLSLVLKYI